MTSDIGWPTEFAKVISCSKCNQLTCRHLLRDDEENIPQPGYIGLRYFESRVLLVGQNPGTPKSRQDQDRPYTAALRRVRDEPTDRRLDELSSVLKNAILRWPITSNYFPLDECGLTIEDIAYCNVIRCRTDADKKPNMALAQECVHEHFVRWLRLLAPNVVVFIGKWAWEHGHLAVERAGIPCLYMNRQRSFSSSARAANREEVTKLVRECRGQL